MPLPNTGMSFDPLDQLTAEDLNDFVENIEYLETALSALYPVGSVYTNASVATNPATLLGFGTWSAFGTGRVMVGVDAGQTEFDTLGETGGSKFLHAHSHTFSATTSTGGSHAHGIGTTRAGLGGAGGSFVNGPTIESTGSAGSHNHTVSGTTAGTGTGNAQNLQPYITVHMWVRTA